MSKIADLYGLLGLKVDKASFQKSEQFLIQYSRKVEELDQKRLDSYKALEQRRAEFDRGQFAKMLEQRRAGLAKLRAEQEKNTLGARFKGSSVGKAIGFGEGGVTAAGVAGGVTAGLAAAGYAAYKAGQDAFSFDDALTRLTISSNGAVGSFDEVRKKILDVSKESGVAKEEILAGAQAFVAITGDGKAATESMATFAKVSKASAASVDEVAQVAAALSQQMNIAPKDFEQAFSILIAGGKAGAVEFKDMAARMSEVAAAGAQFQGVMGNDGLARLSSMFQIVKQGFGGEEGPRRAATALVTLLGELGDKSKVLEQHGIRVFEKDATGKEVRGNLSVILDKVSKLSASTRQGIFGLESSKALDQLFKAPGALDDLIAKTRNANDVNTDAAKYQQSATAKVAKAWNDVKIAIAEAFTPERVQAFADILKGALGFVVDLVHKIESFLGGGSDAYGPQAGAIKSVQANAPAGTTPIQSAAAGRVIQALLPKPSVASMYGGTGDPSSPSMHPDDIAARNAAIARLAHPTATKYSKVTDTDLAAAAIYQSVALKIDINNGDPQKIAEAVQAALNEQVRNAHAAVAAGDAGSSGG